MKHGLDFVRTPDARFDGIDWPYLPRYVEGLAGLDGLRVHYVDVGPSAANAPTTLCLHGQPTWGYLYRKMIPVFAAAGQRVIAPDLYGFGRSDKPVDDDVYSFELHRRTLLSFVEQLDLRDVTLVVQDWGGILGLTLPMAMPGRFSRLVVMNTAFPAGQPLGEGFEQWRSFVAANPEFDIPALIRFAEPSVTEREAAGYAAPFPDARYRAGVRRFPALVPTDASMAGASVVAQARSWFSREWRGDTFMAVGQLDTVLGPETMEHVRATIRGCPPPLVLPHAGHFVQEHGDIVATHALAAFAGTDQTGADQ